jgi:segregation and condensation protein B
MSERPEMEAAIEAILFVSSEPVPRTRLIELFEEDEREQAAEALAAVLARYGGDEGRGVMVEDVAGGVRLVTRPETGTWLRRFFEVASGSKLSMAALETLAIVAYRQPITGPEIQELRSVNPVGVLKTLLEKRLVRIAGRKEVVGKPFLYATTREFLVHFGLNALRDLPPLEEFEETFGAAAPGAQPADREEGILREAAALADRDAAREAAEAEEAGDEEVEAGGEGGPTLWHEEAGAVEDEERATGDAWGDAAREDLETSGDDEQGAAARVEEVAVEEVTAEEEAAARQDDLAGGDGHTGADAEDEELVSAEELAGGRTEAQR